MSHSSVPIPDRSLLKLGLGTGRYRLTGHRVPLHAFWVVTRRCDALCGYCSVPLKRVHELEMPEAVALVDQLAQLGTTHLTFSGGEPLLRPDIGVLVARCTAHGIFTRMETAGGRLPDRLSELHGLGAVVLPLDGRQPVHDALREHGAFKKFCRASEAVLQTDIRLTAAFTLTRENLGEIPHVLELARRDGFEVLFQVLQSAGAPYGGSSARLQPETAEMQQALREVLEARLAGLPVANSEKALRYLLSWKDYQHATAATPHEDLHCLAGQLYCAIDADGSVYPCPMKIGGPGMNIREVGFPAAFDALRDHPCRACTSSQLTEYNFLYNLNLPALIEWGQTRMRQRGP